MPRRPAAPAGRAAGGGAAPRLRRAEPMPSQQTAEQLIEGEVRERARQHSLDAMDGDATTIMGLIEEVTRGYEERSLTADLPALPDRDAAVEAIGDRLIGLGPLQAYLKAPEIEEVWWNRPDRIFVAKAGQSILTTTLLTDQQVRDLVERMLRPSGRRVDLSSPSVDATLADGSRLHVVIPPITRRHWAVNIRKFLLRAHSLDELVRLDTLTAPCAAFLRAAVVAGLNLVVAGANHAGKTTLLNCLAAAIPSRERVLTCEEVFELQVELMDTVAMQTRQPNLEGTGEIRQRRLITEAQRMRPDRLIVGEVRQEEALDLLNALNCGIPGMTSIHANSAREALVKLRLLPLLAGENISDRFILPTVAATIHLVVFLKTSPSGRRQVHEILAVTGRVEGEQIETTPIFQRDGDQLRWVGGYPPHRDRFTLAGYNLAAVLSS